jgi:RNA polymerase sigma-B factor
MSGSSTQATADRGRRKPDPVARAERARRTEELFREVLETDDPARRRALLDEVVLLNRSVAEAVAARYRGRGVPQEDLEQSAFEGLVRAVHKFDPTIRPDLLSYAVPTIRGEVLRWFRDQSWIVRPPRSIQETQWKVSRSVSRLAQELGREPSGEEIGADIGCTADDVSEAVQALGCFRPSSLDRPVAGAHHTTLGEVIADQQEHSYEAADVRHAGTGIPVPARAGPQGPVPAIRRATAPRGDRCTARDHPDAGVAAAEPDSARPASAAHG